MDSSIDLDRDELLTLTEAAHLLKVGPATVYRWLQAKKLPGFRKGGRLVVRKADLEAFLTPLDPPPPPAFRQEQRRAQAYSKRTTEILKEAGILP